MGQENRSEPRLRSRGQVTIFSDGLAGLPATIRDIGVSGLGLLAAGAVPVGTRVQIESHGHVAEGVVRQCRFEGGSFQIGVALEARPADP